MSTDALPSSNLPRMRGLTGTSLVVATALTAWFAVIVLLGASGGFVSTPGTPPLGIAIGFAAPLVLFFVLLRLSRAFREFVLAIDLRVMLGIQAWRFAGLGFLALYTYHVLPGTFALPAGLGDIAIGLTAPWLLFILIHRPAFAGTRAFRVWNALGLLDLFVAVSTGALSAALATGVAGEITTGPMAELPLVLVPAFLVPILAMLHVAAFMQARRFATP